MLLNWKISGIFLLVVLMHRMYGEKLVYCLLLTIQLQILIASMIGFSGSKNCWGAGDWKDRDDFVAIMEIKE